MKEQPTKMASQAEVPIVSSYQAAALTLPLEPKKALQQNPSNDDDETVATKAPSLEAADDPQNSHTKPRSPAPKQTDGKDEQRKVDQVAEMAMAATEEENVRERLKRHRVEVAGRVWIPDMWGQEELLKDWIDCTAFDAPLVNSNIMLARAALIEEGRLRASASGIRIENSC